MATGGIAKAFAQGVQHSRLGTLAAVGSRSSEQARAFAAQFDIPNAHGSYEELLADPEVEAVYISTPHPFHAEWIVKAAEAGKHVLCEKPIALNHAEAMAAAEAARKHDVLLMEAFMVRCHPFIETLKDLIRDKVIGDVRLIQATFSFHGAFHPEGRLFSNALGGGGILGSIIDMWHKARNPSLDPSGPMAPGAGPTPPPGAGPAPALPPGYVSTNAPGSETPATSNGPAGGPATGRPALPPGYYPTSGPPPPWYLDPAAAGSAPPVPAPSS